MQNQVSRATDNQVILHQDPGMVIHNHEFHLQT